jgi:hypothetical protein
MSGFVAVFRREVLIRRLVIVAAAFAGLVPFIVPVARGLHGDVAADERASIALIVSIAFAFGMAVGLGGSMAAPAIASRRIAFDFTRPLSSLDIWLGRAAAAWTLALVSAAIVLLPTLVAGGRALGDFAIDPRLQRIWPLVVCGAILPVYAAAHALGVVTRSRSPLLALDLVLGGVAGLAIAGVLGRLPAFLAATPRWNLAVGLAIAVVVALVASGYMSVERGRTDIRSSHHVLSASFWSILGVSIAAAAAYAAWVRGAGPSNLRSFWTTPAPRGSWVELQGEARGATATFLLDTATGRTVRPLTRDWMAPTISLDGRRAAWVQGRDGGGPFEVMTLALDAPASVPAATKVSLRGYPELFVLSADGARLASVLDGVLSIDDLGSGRTVASARIARDWGQVRGFFLDTDRFRVYVYPAPGGRAGRLEISELDARTKTLSRLGSRELPAGGVFLMADRSGERLVAIEWPTKRAVLLDGRTGSEIAALGDGGAGVSRWPRFLADGRIALSESSPTGAAIRVFDRQGRAGRVVAVHSRHIILGGELAPGRLVAAAGDEGREKWTASIVDLDAGSLRPVGEGLMPTALTGPSYALNAFPEPGSEATRLFLRNAYELVRLDPSAGELRVIFRGREPKP